MHLNLDAWLACFERRAAEPPSLPSHLDDRLAPAERERIAHSIAVFQLGEQSEGRTLLELARRHAARHGWPALVPITASFIREEQRHAATLLAYMQDHDIPRRQHDWTDGVFRRLRRLASFELALIVLITAELLGIQFYRALMNSTGSQRLRAICLQFLQDEALHVAYESELLLALRARRPAPLRALIGLAHLALHMAAALVVWREHRRVLRGAGHTATGFLRTCCMHYALYFVTPPPRSLSTGQRRWGRKWVSS